MSGKLLFDLRGLSPHAAAWQSRGGSVLALASKDSVKLWDRSGQLVAENAAKQALIAWDSDGQILSIIPSKSQSLTVLMMSNKQSRVIEFDLKDQLVCQAWSKNTNSLAIGTSKGSLILVDFKTDKKVPVLGKHGKKISHAVWSKDNRLALASIDGMISVNDSKGDLIVSQRLRAEPQDLQFGSMKSDQRSHAPDTISVLQEKRSIFLWRYEGEEQSELSFQASYGKIISYSWYGDGYLAIAFDTGRLIGVSTHIAEIGTEIFNIQDHSEFCSSMKLTNDGIKLATAGEDSIRVHSVANMKVTDSIIPIPDETAGGFRAIQWSDNGALIAALSNSGTIYVFLTELTVMGQSNGNKLAYLSSLSEMTLFEPNTESKKIKLGMEPSFVGLGPADLCYGFNNKAKFHQLDDGSLTEKEYVASVKRVSVGNDYAVGLLSDGRLQLHLIVDDGMTPEKSVKIFPDGKSQDGNIIAAEIRGEMLIYATSGGKLRFFLLDEWTEVNCLDVKKTITAMYCDTSGARTLLIDDVNKGYVYTAGDDTLMEVGELPGRVNGCLWDAVETHVFTVWDNQNQLVVFSVHDLHVEGQKVEQVAIGRKPKGQSPLLLSSGLLFLQTSSGKLNRITLPSHKGSGPAEMSDLENAIRLRNWSSAQEICAELDDPKAWNKAAEGAVRCIEIEAAMRFYQKVQHAGMVLNLMELKNEEDIFYLRGACSVLLRNFDVAQKAFLQSSEPIAALELRRDLQHWEESLSLANRLAPERIPEIAREYAAQQEFEGNYSGALGNYERAIQDGSKTLSKEQLFLASSGIARCSLRMGDLRRGLQLANNSSSKVLKRECADILDKMKQYTQAGMLYVKGEFWEKAAASFLKGKESNRVAEIIDKVDAVKIHMAFAKTREAEGKIDEALTAYGRAGDEDARIRLLLSSGRTLEAEEIVKETGSLEGADRIARYYIKKGDYGSAIEFLVLSDCNTEAFQLAQQHSQMETYAEIIGNRGGIDDFKSIAIHFENDGNFLQSGKFFLKAGEYDRALNHFLRVKSADDENISLAIETVGEAKDEKLSRTLLDFLLGQHDDGQSKNAKFLFQFYVSLDQYQEAASTAIIIARDHQLKGDYKKGREFLFQMYKDLRIRGIRLPAEMSSSLLLLHSYLLIRPTLSVRNDHMTAARLLTRVAKSISKFPKHIVQLLTKTVIECNKVGLQRSAFEYAALLMRPEYREAVDQKYRRPIEKLVRDRRGANEEDPPAESTPCPFCSKKFDSYELTCPFCREVSPFCIATGRHVTVEDLTKCPTCESPALIEPLAELVNSDGHCPMCSASLNNEDLVIIENAATYLKQLA